MAKLKCIKDIEILYVLKTIKKRLRSRQIYSKAFFLPSRPFLIYESKGKKKSDKD